MGLGSGRKGRARVISGKGSGREGRVRATSGNKEWERRKSQDYQ